MLLNVACCTWIDNHWGEWVAGSGARVETRLQKMRDKKSLQKPVSWIEQGTAGALRARRRDRQRDPGGRHRSDHHGQAGRIPAESASPSISYGLIFTGVYSLCGYMLGRLIALF